MIIREVLKIANSIIYRNHSDKGVYIKNKTDGTLWTEVNSLIDYEYEETDIKIEESDIVDIEENSETNIEKGEK